MATASKNGFDRTLRLLATTPNTAARDLLLGLLRAPGATDPQRAARALASRDDAESHEQLLLALPDCDAAVRRAISGSEAVSRLRKAARAAIAGDDPDFCRRVCRYAVEVEDVRLLPDLVDAAMQPSGPVVDIVAPAALELAGVLCGATESKKQDAASLRSGPGYARRVSVQRLEAALDRFRDHRRVELIDALLLLADATSVALRMVLRDSTSAAHGPLKDRLETSPGRCAMELLIQAMEDADAPDALLEIAAARSDTAYLSRLFSALGERPGLRVQENAQRLSRFGWAEPGRRRRLLELSGPEQAAAMRLFTAAKTEAEDRAELVALLLGEGGDEGRVAACESLKRIKTERVGALLRQAMDDRHPGVVAAAAVQLRRNSYDQGLTELVALLDHTEQSVVASAQQALGEFSLDSYREVYLKLTPEQRAMAGPLVAKADPDAVEAIARDLMSPAPDRRQSAVELVIDLGIVDRLIAPVIGLLEDDRAEQRAAAAEALGASTDRRAIDALATVVNDPSAAVRRAAESGLRRGDGVSVAERLLEGLEAELGAGAPGGDVPPQDRGPEDARGER